MSASITNTWTVNGKTKLNDRLDVTDETYVSNKKLKTIATSGDFADLINVPVLQGTIANPPDLTAATTAFATVTATSKTPAAGYDGYFAFNAGAAASRWIGGDGLYDATTSAYLGTTSTTFSNFDALTNISFKGEYVQIRFPGSINPLAWIFSEFSGARAFTVVLAASVDGNSYVKLSQSTNADKLKRITLASTNQAYPFFRIIVSACNNSTCLNDVKLFTAAVPVNADWSATTGQAAVLNKPTIPAAQINSDWLATTGLAQILNKPSVATASYTAIPWTALPTGLSYSTPPQYCRTTDGRVTVRGQLNNWNQTSSQIIGTLPAGCCPSITTYGSAISNWSWSNLQVATSGAITVPYVNSGLTTWIRIDSFSFMCY